MVKYLTLNNWLKLFYTTIITKRDFVTNYDVRYRKISW